MKSNKKREYKIRIDPAIAQQLKLKKVHPRQSYSEVIENLLRLLK